MSRRSALVTGATGFIGRHLAQALLDDGVAVTLLVRSAGTLAPALAGRARIVVCEDWRGDRLRASLGDLRVESVFHLAAYGVRPQDRDPDLMRRVNVEAAEALVEISAASGASLVMAGSSAEYRAPHDTKPLAETAAIETDKLYGASKAAGAASARDRAAALGVKLRVLRLFNVFGPGEAPHRLLPHLFGFLSAGRHVPLSEGSQIRDFIHVGDVVAAFLAADALLRDRATIDAAIWNVCTGRGRSVRDFASATAAAMKADPALLGFGEQAMRPDETPFLVGDPAKIQAELGWRPRYNLEQGVHESIAALGNGALPAMAGRRS